MNNCPICKKINPRVLYELYDDRYGYPGDYKLLECESCHHKFLDHKFSSADLTDLYSNYYPRSSFSIDDFKPLEFKKGFKSWFNGEGRSAYTYVPENVTVLDIGCGFGQSLAYHQSRGCDAFGVEADSNIKRVAEKFGFNVKVGLFDPSDYKPEIFDYVTMDQVIEHVTNPADVLNGINSILKDSGYLVLSFPNASGWAARFFGKKWINWHTPYHLHFYSKKSIQLLAKENGFEVVKSKTITSSEWLNYQWLHLLAYPKHGEKSKFWSSSVSKPSVTLRIGFKLVSILHRLKLNHIVTRIFDGLDVGDSLLILMKKKSKT
ncbi:MAG: class I SAM-dependent methyltransferase [Methyloprofundus sp.]|nr:class I SAM-dependent methyltransferase [Methyloprofundus sp.]